MEKSLSGGQKLAKALAVIAEKVKNPGTLRVGFLEGATYPDGTSVAMVAAINEFGAPGHGQPPRPFFRQMIAKCSQQWGPTLQALLIAHDYDARAALELMGEGIRGQLQQSINDLMTPELALSTKRSKGFDKPLIDTSHMINSVDKEVV